MSSSSSNLENNQHVEQSHSDQISPHVKGEPPHDSGAKNVVRVRADESSAITRINDPLNDRNWIIWRQRMTLMLELCGVEAYVQGRTICPNPIDDPEGASIWAFNDAYARLLIINNIEETEMVYASRCKSSHEMWASLEAVHEPRNYRTTISYMRDLFHTTAEEGDNICDHLGKLEQYWEWIGLSRDRDLTISEPFFNAIISASLPPSWDTFTESYVGGRAAGIIDGDLKRRMGSQHLIHIIKDEYVRRELRKRHGADTHSVYDESNRGGPSSQRSSSLVSRIPNPNAGSPSNTPEKPQSTHLFCKFCRQKNHNVEDCRHLGKIKCGSCGKFGHAQNECWFNNKTNKRTWDRENKPTERPPRKGGNESKH